MKPRYPILGMLALVVAGCNAGTPQTEAVRSEMALALGPLSTTSKTARQEFADGVYESDMNRPPDSYTHFERAIAADPNFALAEAMAAFTAQAQPDAYAHITRALQLLDHASPVEKLQIEAQKKIMDGDDGGAAALFQQAVKIAPDNPRLWTVLGFEYLTLGEQASTRAAADSAIARGPQFELGYILKSITYTLYAPYNLQVGEAAARKAVELYPNEADPHDYLGDAYRAAGKLDQAASEYTKCAELDPTRGLCLQQRGHVNTFLGKYPEARADYDAAVALATGNAKPNLAQYRAFASVYEGNPKAAVDELEKLYQSIDAMNIPEPVGVKIVVDSQTMAIAEHAGFIKEAERSVQRRAQLAQQRAQQLNSPQFAHQVACATALDAGFLALAKGDYATATAKANEYVQLRRSDASSSKDRSAHDLMGLIAVKQKHWAEAVAHFQEGTADDIYFNYWQAVAHENLGHKAEALALYRKVANFNFDNVGEALTRKDAQAKVQQLGATT